MFLSGTHHNSVLLKVANSSWGSAAVFEMEMCFLDRMCHQKTSQIPTKLAWRGLHVE